MVADSATRRFPAEEEQGADATQPIEVSRADPVASAPDAAAPGQPDEDLGPDTEGTDAEEALRPHDWPLPTGFDDLPLGPKRDAPRPEETLPGQE